MEKKKVVIFIPHRQYVFEQQMAAALYVAEQGGYEPHFLLITVEDQEFIGQLDASGLSYSALGPIGCNPPEPLGQSNGAKPAAIKLDPHGRSKWYRRTLGLFATILPGGRLTLACWRLWEKSRKVRKLVQILEPYCAVVSQERPRIFLPALKTLREMKVPVILVLAADSTPDGSAWMRRESYMHKAGLNQHVPPHNYFIGVKWSIAIFNRLVQRWLPSQVYNSRWGKMLFYSPEELLSLRIMGMLPRNPWYQGTTFADHIVISGTDEAAMYAEAKVDPEKLLMFGCHELDLMHQQHIGRAGLRQKLIDSYQLDCDAPIIIMTLPPLWEHDMIPEEMHWRILAEILEALSRRGCNVLVSLHPRMDSDLYAWVEERYPARIVKEALRDILSAADIFVGAYSSTIRWAVAFDIPVINLDLWELHYDIYKEFSNYQVAATIPEFEELLQEWTSTRTDAAPAGESSSHAGSSGIVADGKAKERLLGFIDSLDGAARQPAASMQA